MGGHVLALQSGPNKGYGGYYGILWRISQKREKTSKLIGQFRIGKGWKLSRVALLTKVEPEEVVTTAGEQNIRAWRKGVAEKTDQRSRYLKTCSFLGGIETGF
jgi:hypothetical protein